MRVNQTHLIGQKLKNSDSRARDEDEQLGTLWFRTNDTLVDADHDDAAMLELVCEAQSGSDVAMAGLLLAMKNRRQRFMSLYYSKVTSDAVTDRYEANGSTGRGWVDSCFAIAVNTYDVESGQTNVARRLYMDTKYILRAPSKLALAKLSTIEFVRDDFNEPMHDSVEPDFAPQVIAMDEARLRNRLWNLPRGRESEERFAVMVDGLVLVWLHGWTKKAAAEHLGVNLDSLKFHVKRSRAGLATEEFREELLNVG